MFGALSKSFAQLPEAALLRSVILCMFAALFMIVACGVLSWLLIVQLGFFGDETYDKLAAWVGAIVLVFGACLVYPSTVMVVAGFFLDSVAGAVETKHYPLLPEPRHQGLGEILKSAFLLLGITLFLNMLLVVPVYLPSILFPPLGMAVFYVLNGYLLGREFFEMIATRHIGPEEARTLRRSHRWAVLAAGVVVAIMTTIPVLNLAAPVIATAFMVHVFQMLRGQTDT